MDAKMFFAMGFMINLVQLKVSCSFLKRDISFRLRLSCQKFGELSLICQLGCRPFGVLGFIPAFRRPCDNVALKPKRPERPGHGHRSAESLVLEIDKSAVRDQCLTNA